MNNRPTTITAGEFIKQGYAAKVAAGECEVIGLHPHTGEYYVTGVEYNLDTPSSMFANTKVLDEDVDVWDVGSRMASWEGEVFEVRWLDTAPTSTPDGGEGEGSRLASRLRELRAEYDPKKLTDVGLLNIAAAAGELILNNKRLDLVCDALTAQDTLHSQLADAQAENARLRAAMERIIALAPAGKPKYPNSASESDYVWHGRDSAYWHAAEIFAEAQAGGEG